MVWGQNVSLQFAKHDLHLIEPARILRQPVDPHFECEVQARDPAAQLLGGVRRTVIQDQMQHSQPSAVRAREQLFEERLELDESRPLFASSEGQPRSHHERAEQLQCASRDLASRHLHRGTRPGRPRGVHSFARLNRRLLVDTANRFAWSARRLACS
jgi:hypothetical protein